MEGWKAKEKKIEDEGRKVEQKGASCIADAPPTGVGVRLAILQFEKEIKYFFPFSTNSRFPLDSACNRFAAGLNVVTSRPVRLLTHVEQENCNIASLTPARHYRSIRTPISPLYRPL